MTIDDLRMIIDKHVLWLLDKTGGVRANLSGADLSWADLSGADLSWADLSGADLSWANLSWADLSRANLSGANLSGANLSWADLSRANLSGANLSWAKLPAFMVCPEVGSFTSYKKGRNGEIITLIIPASARRTSSLVGRKCRASKAKVISIINSDGDKLESCQCWNRDYLLEYRVGKMVVPDKYDDDIRVECTPGIHFFITKQEAIDL